MAKQEHIKIANGEEHLVFTKRISNQTYALARNSRLLLCALIEQTPPQDVILEVRLEGSDARADFFFVYIGKKTNNLRLHVIVKHLAGSTTARVWGRSILFDSARSDIRGTCIIEKKALHADTFFSHHALLLSSSSHAVTVPSLEIFADDVKAGHAATAGPLREEESIYLQSRGIPSSQAKRILVQGFLTADVVQIPDLTMRKKLERSLSRYFPL